MKVLFGNEVANKITSSLIQDVTKLNDAGVIPTLATIRVGHRPEDISYETGIQKRCQKIGVNLKKIILPQNCTQNQLLEEIKKINKDTFIDGCLIFRPLPSQMDDEIVRNSLSPEKDMDGITDLSLAGIFTGTPKGYSPCTPDSCVNMLKYYGINVNGKNVVIIGRSLVLGRPLAMMLMKLGATITICHSHTKNLKRHCVCADIIVAATGHTKLVTKDMVGANQILIDVGISETREGNLCGDVDFEHVAPLVEAITPVPGGVGSVTTTILAKHVIDACRKKVINN